MREMEYVIRDLEDVGCKFINKIGDIQHFFCPCGIVQLTTSDGIGTKKVVRIRLVDDVLL